LLVLTIALLVLGPRRALAIVEVVGLMIGKAKGALADLQAQVEKELRRKRFRN